MSTNKKGFIGIDVGTQGVRLILTDQHGREIFSKGESFPLTDHSREEQSPKEWWEACLRLLSSMSWAIQEELEKGLTIVAISTTSTSGTVIPIDEHHEPLYHAIMYSDKRSANCSVRIKALAETHFAGQYGYTNFNSSSGLSKMVWFVETFPEQAKKIKRWIHAADYIIGQLSGCFDTTDETNALKSGYDVKIKEWPSYIYEELPIKKAWLQHVVPIGEVLTSLKSEWSERLGLNSGILVVAGLTDGCASQIASGAVHVGDWNTTIGTTMVIKGITVHEVLDPEGRLYSHRHPQGYWMPGGAANIGADWVNDFSLAEVENFSRMGAGIIPTPFLTYPLMTEGERFPFIAPEAKSFQSENISRMERFVSSMEGLAYVERYAYDMIEVISGEKVTTVYAAGGASHNDLWMKIRSNVLRLPVKKMQHISGAMGAAMIAASGTYFKNLLEATENMTTLEKEFQPEDPLSTLYEEKYKEFIALLKRKNYIKKTENYA